MARKPLFKSLVEGADGSETPDQSTTPFPASRPMQKMRTSLIELQKSSIQDIKLDLIEDFEFHDRIDVEEDLDGLTRSLDERGQEVPIKVRPIENGNRFQVIIGRRRCAAARRLGWTSIKGMIQDTSDLEALSAMITENSERRETSYIGRARLCQRVVQSGISQRDVAKAMGCSQPHISQMLRSYNLVGDDVILAVGDADLHGRKAWDIVGEAMEAMGLESHQVVSMVDRTLPSSSDRLAALVTEITALAQNVPPSPALSTGNTEATQPGNPAVRDLWKGVCRMKRSGKTVTIKGLKKAPEDMIDFLEERIPALIEEYKNIKSGS